MSAFTRFLGYIGLTDLERRHSQWRYQQISLDIEEAETECAQLAAYIGTLKKEREEIKQEIFRAE